MVTDDEVVELLRALEALAIQVGLDGLVEQERATARAGQITEFQQGGRNGAPETVAPRKGEFRIEQVGPHQRLATLLDLLEAAVVGADLTEKAVLAAAHDFVERGSVETAEVTFDVPSESSDLLTQEEGLGIDDPEPTRRVLSSLRSMDREAAIVEVVSVIRELREQAGLARGEWLLEVEEGQRRGVSWPA